MSYGKDNDIIKLLEESGIKFKQKEKTSLQFDTGGENYFDYLCRTFNLNCEDFKPYFSEAISGEGTEGNKIDSIWSSSLLALLFFYSAIRQNGGIKIRGIDGALFDRCCFEFRNPAMNPSKPSCPDCVLLSSDKRHIVFVECKFTEYLSHKKAKLSEKYANDECTKQIANKFSELQNRGESHYFEGIKQVITHYYGICNFLKDMPDHPELKNGRKRVVIDEYRKGAKVHFLEVVYDFYKIGKDKYKDRLDDYKNIHSKFIDMINAENPELDALPLTTYQEILQYSDNFNKLSKEIKNFYKL